MKKYPLVLIIMLFVLNVSAQIYLHPNVYSKKYVIGTPIKLGNIEVAEHLVVRSPTKDNDSVWCNRNYYQALDELEKLGDGWRLPTKEELHMIDMNNEQNGKWLFYPFWYWSSSLSKEGAVIAYQFSIDDPGYCFILSPYNRLGFVIAVRDIK